MAVFMNRCLTHGVRLVQTSNNQVHMVSLNTLKKLAREHGTPLFVVDHAELRRNYATFKKHQIGRAHV